MLFSMNVVSCFFDDCFLVLCRFCGFFYVGTDVMCCPFCNSGNLKVVPLRDHPNLSLEWLVFNGFLYLDDRLEVKCVVE